MDMMSCPHCGASNSRKRATCFQCENDLHTAPKPAQGTGVTCAVCGQVARTGPPGQAIPHDHVWCTYRAAAVLPTTVAGTCFREGFGWNREQIMD